ncbi:MAG: cytochrome b N-terminal domain-containing protein [Planctomycetota bacterium]|nr:cytochrome b N-terminal domain-containing protein [Planctomycetota bacterium]
MAEHEQGIPDMLKAALRSPIPHELRGDLGLGALVIALFLLQVFTGILMSLYYQPSPDAVAESVQYIMRDVSWGWLVRGLHHWSSSALIVACLVHLARAVLAARYRGRAWYWYLGVLATMLVILSAFTGELLTWDNDAYWRVRAILADVETIPLVGPELAAIVRGGSEVSATTLSRTYSAHSLFVPWMVWMLLISSFGLIVRDVRRGKAGGS